MAKADKDAKGDERRRRSARARREHWKEEPDDHDYPAAGNYLSLLLPEPEISQVVEALKEAPIVRRMAKDLLRASRLALLDERNPHVAEDLAKVRRGERLSPVLLVRGSLLADVPLTVADGYHRICASYHLDENAAIPCRLVDAPRPVAASQGAVRVSRRTGSRPARASVGNSSAKGREGRPG